MSTEHQSKAKWYYLILFFGIVMFMMLCNVKSPLMDSEANDPIPKQWTFLNDQVIISALKYQEDSLVYFTPWEVYQHGRKLFKDSTKRYVEIWPKYPKVNQISDNEIQILSAFKVDNEVWIEEQVFEHGTSLKSRRDFKYPY